MIYQDENHLKILREGKYSKTELETLIEQYKVMSNKSIKAKIYHLRKIIAKIMEIEKYLNWQSGISQSYKKYINELNKLRNLNGESSINLNIGKIYVETCKKYKLPDPSLKQLREVAHRSRGELSKEINKGENALVIRNELIKQRNYSRNQDSVHFWSHAIEIIEHKLTKISDKKYNSRKEALKDEDDYDEANLDNDNSEDENIYDKD